MTQQPSVPNALGKDISEVLLPAIDGRSPYAAKGLESFKSKDRISLAQSADQQQHGSPVYPPAPEPNRWWQDPTTAPRPTAAQAEAYLKSLLQFRGPTSRLSQVVGPMQWPPAEGQRWARVRSAMS